MTSSSFCNRDLYKIVHPGQLSNNGISFSGYMQCKCTVTPIEDQQLVQSFLWSVCERSSSPELKNK